MPSDDSDADEPERPDTPLAAGEAAGLTERQLYDAVHAAVNNAVWDVVGTVALTLFGLGAFLVGLLILFNGAVAPSEPRVGVVVFGTLVAGLSGFGLLRLYDYV